MNKHKKPGAPMGNIYSMLLKYFGYGASHVIHVRTGDRKGAGTDANVWIKLRDEHGHETEEIKLNHWLKDDNERGRTSSFHVPDLEHLGRVVEVVLFRDTFGINDSWFVDLITVENLRVQAKHYFPIQRWIKPNEKHVFREFDCCLPQHEKNQEQRSRELCEKQITYQYKTNVPGGPAQIKELPEDETFSEYYMLGILKLKMTLALTTTWMQWTINDKWNSFDDFKNKFYSKSWANIYLTEPECLSCWKDDRFFGLQRVQGCNPVLIRLCKAIPEKFGVTEEMVIPFLEGLTLSEAIQNNRLFIVDLEMLKDLNTNDCRTLCSPLALFFLNKEQDLMPIAIQLFQDKAPDNPVFLPSDPEYTWLMAKMYYNNADATYHQAHTHLGFTHLIMEGVVICTHRNLSPSHPLFRLMAPHFLFLLAINSRGLEKLVSKGGWVDKTMTCGREGMFALIKRGLAVWRLDTNGNIPKEIESRGVSDPKILPHYPYRDDANRIFKAIEEYVTQIVNYYYKTEDDIKNDVELQQWRRELVLDRRDNNCEEVSKDIQMERKDEEVGGVGLLGVPGDERGFRTHQEVIDSVSAIIAICSIGHAAANFQQYDEYAFPPNYPALLNGDVPRNKDPLTEEDILLHLPDKGTTLDTMVITKILSGKGTNSLGNFEVQYMYDPIGIDAAATFQNKLKKISIDIQNENYTRKRNYRWLDPQIVPNAISI